MRAQTELPALGIAFVLLTGVVVLGVSVADSSFASAERPAVEQQTATSLSERLVSERGRLTTRANVLDAESLTALDESTLREQYGVPADADVRIRLDGDDIVTTGDVTDGTTVERIVLVERRTERTIRPDFDSRRTVVLPRRSSNVTLTIAPQSGTSVRRVLANDRVVLANGSGLTGTFEADISSLATTRLRFEAVGPLAAGSVRIVYAPSETTKALLAVTVDA